MAERAVDPLKGAPHLAGLGVVVGAGVVAGQADHLHILITRVVAQKVVPLVRRVVVVVGIEDPDGVCDALLLKDAVEALPHAAVELGIAEGDDAAVAGPVAVQLVVESEEQRPPKGLDVLRERANLPVKTAVGKIKHGGVAEDVLVVLGRNLNGQFHRLAELGRLLHSGHGKGHVELAVDQRDFKAVVEALLQRQKFALIDIHLQRGGEDAEVHAVRLEVVPVERACGLVPLGGQMGLGFAVRIGEPHRLARPIGLKQRPAAGEKGVVRLRAAKEKAHIVLAAGVEIGISIDLWQPIFGAGPLEREQITPQPAHIKRLVTQQIQPVCRAKALVGVKAVLVVVDVALHILVGGALTADGDAVVGRIGLYKKLTEGAVKLRPGGEVERVALGIIDKAQRAILLRSHGFDVVGARALVRRLSAHAVYETVVGARRAAAP